MQQITPLEIRQKRFEKSFRGYNQEEVDAFLYSLAYAWEQSVAKLSDMTAQLESSNGEVKRLQEVENALLKTMNDSETTAKNIVDQARREATLKIRESEAEAKRILADAQDKAKIAKDNSDRYEQQLREQGQNTLATIKKTIQEAEAYRDSLLHQLQHAAEDILTRSQLLKSKVDTNPYSDTLPDEVLDIASPPTTATQPTTTEQPS